MKIRNRLKYVPGAGQEYIQGPSETVPDDCLTIQEIMKRHVNGMNQSTLHRTPTGYLEEPDYDDDDLSELSRADLFDREEYAHKHRQIIAEHEKMQETARNEAAEAKKKAEESALKAKWLEEQAIAARSEKSTTLS